MSKVIDWGPKAYDQYLADTHRYLANPLLAVQELFGIGLCKCKNGSPCQLDHYQKKMIIAVFKIIIAKMKQGAGQECIKEEADKLGVLVQSAKGTGKTATAAMITILFMFCLPMSKIFLVGPKEDQIKTGIWPEIAKWFGHATMVYGENNILNRMFDMPGEMIYARAFVPEKSLKKEWVTKILTFPKNSDEEQQKLAIQGKHAKYMLFVLEEAPGIPDHIFEAIRGTCTDPEGVNMCLGIFNPNKNTGWALEGMKEPKTFTGIHISAENSSLVSKAYIEQMARKYGIESNKYRVAVLGLPPLNGNDGMFPWNWLMAGRDRSSEFIKNPNDDLILGCDIGGGGDHSIICIRRGAVVLDFEKNESDDTTVLATWILKAMSRYKPTYTIIDKNGVGHGVHSALRSCEGVIGFNSKNTSHNPERFVMMRDQVFWNLRDAFESGSIAIPDDDELIGELSVMKYEESNTGLIKLVSKQNANFKKEMKEAVGYRSPNKSDSLAMTYYKDYSKRIRDDFKKRSLFNKPQQVQRGNLSWMGS